LLRKIALLPRGEAVHRFSEIRNACDSFKTNIYFLLFATMPPTFLFLPYHATRLTDYITLFMAADSKTWGVMDPF